MAGRMITFNDKTMNVKAWAKEMDITYVSLRSRLSLGWSVERALTTPTRRRDVINKKFKPRGGHVTILGPSGEKIGNAIIYRCRCNHCGSEIMIPSNNLTNAASNHSLYNTWILMIRRCESQNDPNYKYYGGKGIKVCERWRKSFIDFVADMGHRPSPKYTVDRINGKKNYEPDNCRWATEKQQARNRKNAIMIEYRGKTQCLATWAEELGITYSALYSRYRNGWSTERMMSPKNSFC